MLTFFNFLVIFGFVFVSVGLLQLIRIGASQWLRWDIGEKERLLQQRLTELTYECDRYKEEVADLRKQIKLLLGQYDEAIIKLNKISGLYTAAQADVERLKRELEQMQQDVRQFTSVGGRILIAAVGEGNGFALDTASLWAVNTETGLDFEEIKASTVKLTESLDRARSKREVVYLHLAVRSDDQGYQLTDQIVDAGWLAPILAGVIILVVAGSDSSTVGDLLGVVPYVITMNDKISNRDAALFSRAFWSEVGRGLGPSQALARALSVAPARMKPYVTAHWGG